jgi:hypothetical protein
MANQMNVNVSGFVQNANINIKESMGLFIKEQTGVSDADSPDCAAICEFAVSLKKGKGKIGKHEYVENVPIGYGPGRITRGNLSSVGLLELKSVKLKPHTLMRLQLYGFAKTPCIEIINGTDQEFKKSFAFARNFYTYNVEKIDKNDKYDGVQTVKQGWLFGIGAFIALAAISIIAVVIIVALKTPAKEGYKEISSGSRNNNA